MLDLEQIHALAIFMLGAFFIVLVTAVTYVTAIRARLVEPTPPAQNERIAQRLQGDLHAQRTTIEQLNFALDQHTADLKAAMGGTGGALAGLAGVLDAQSSSVTKLTSLLHAQSARLANIDERLLYQDEQLLQLARIDERLIHQDGRLDRLETDVIQAQAKQLETISTQLDEWAATTQPAPAVDHSPQLQEHARLLAELDRELVAQAQAMQGLTNTVDEHTAHLVQAATERQHQTTLLERVLDQVAQRVPVLSNVMAPPPRSGQNRLMDIKGIGPVYAGRLYEAGIHTFAQLAALSETEIKHLVQRKSVAAAGWIEQAKMFDARQRDAEG